MAQEDLIPMSMRSKEEVKAIASKGGINSGKARREKRDLRKCLEALLEAEVHIKDETGEDTGEVISGAEAVTLALYRNAASGDNRAFELLRDTIGQKPIDKVEQTSTQIVVDLGALESDVDPSEVGGTE